jgi:hypothetical protein
LAFSVSRLKDKSLNQDTRQKSQDKNEIKAKSKSKIKIKGKIMFRVYWVQSLRFKDDALHIQSSI